MCDEESLDKYTQVVTIIKKTGRSAYVLPSNDGKQVTVNHRFVRPFTSKILADIDDAYKTVSLCMNLHIA